MDDSESTYYFVFHLNFVFCFCLRDLFQGPMLCLPGNGPHGVVLNAVKRKEN